MMMDPRLAAAIDELGRNLYYLARYAERIRTLAAARSASLTDLNLAEVEALDAFILRFLKTVDAATRRLFPAILASLGEYDEGMPLIDVLNRLEKLSWIGSGLEWRTARERRNPLRCSHDFRC